jgi:hypothetical protein
MKSFNKLFILLSIIVLSSCGGNSIKEKSIKVSDVAISGDAEDYIKVVDGEYTLKVVEDKVVIAIKFELIEECDLDGEPELGNINLIPLDKSGAAVPGLGLDFGPATMSDYDKLKNLLKGEVGKTVIISFEWSYFSDTDIQNRIMTETENFEITNADFTGSESSSDDSGDYDNEDESYSASGDEDWDEVLNSYESYIDQYIKLMKKAQKGDASAMTEYAEMMEKAADLSEKVENAGDNLSTSQLSRFTKLQAKLAQAAMEM